MSILGIDFGLKHIGLALSTNGILAEPLTQINYKNKKQFFEKFEKLIKKYNIKKIIIGISEGEMAEKTKKFGQEVSLKTRIPVAYQDETLSSLEVARKMLESGMPRKKRRVKSHQMVATMILQDFLDEKKNCW